MMKELISKTEAIRLALKNTHAAYLDRIIKDDKLVTEHIANILPLLANNSESGSSIREITDAFGKLFYGALCPINGVSPKNRRFMDGESEVDGYNAEQAGPCVWKFIGNKGRWQGHRPTWFDADKVFNKLTQEHIDLVIDGLRNRQDQRKVAKELFQIREDILEKLEEHFEYKINSTYYGSSNGSNLKTVLNDPIPIDVILYTDIDSFNMPVDALNLNISSFNMDVDVLRVYIDVPTHVYDYLKDNYTINSYTFSKSANSSYQFSKSANSGYQFCLEYNLRTFSYKNPSINYSINMQILGISNLILSDIFTKSLTKLGDDMQEVKDILEDAQEKYAGRLLMKGSF